MKKIFGKFGWKKKHNTNGKNVKIIRIPFKNPEEKNERNSRKNQILLLF
jgi:hypothetical protein